MERSSRYRQNRTLPFVVEGWRGNPTYKGRFFNVGQRPSHGVKNILKWKLSPNPQRREKRTEHWNPPVYRVHTLDMPRYRHKNYLFWIGHNSFYLQLAGKRILFDPVFWDIPMVRRRSKLPASPDIFSDIDYLLLSHDHFDHLNKRSIQQICRQSPGIVILCGMGMDEILCKWVPQARIVPMGWYQKFHSPGDKLSVTFMPAQHWSKRGPNDGGSRLWGSFFLEGDDLSIYYSGDTGYGKHFEEVKPIFGKVDYALMGIGAYKPRWLMEKNHISPDEALDGAAVMEAGTTIPMHYGTFDLASEPLGDPPRVFAQEAARRKMNVRIPHIGEIVELHPFTKK